MLMIFQPRRLRFDECLCNHTNCHPSKFLCPLKPAPSLWPPRDLLFISPLHCGKHFAILWRYGIRKVIKIKFAFFYKKKKLDRGKMVGWFCPKLEAFRKEQNAKKVNFSKQVCLKTLNHF